MKFAFMQADDDMMIILLFSPRSDIDDVDSDILHLDIW
jgi:hypothetical protein